MEGLLLWSLVFQFYLIMAVDKWGDWGQWSECPCGGGIKTRTRSCTMSIQLVALVVCPGYPQGKVETQNCIRERCPDKPVVQTSTTLIVQVGDTVVLPCNVSGHPDIDTVWWTQNGTQISPTAGYHGGTSQEPSLTIINVQKIHGGEYVCHARNSIGESSSTTNVAIRMWDVWQSWTPCKTSCGYERTRRERKCLECQTPDQNPCIQIAADRCGNWTEEKECGASFCTGWYQIFEAYAGIGKSVLDCWLNQYECYTFPKPTSTVQSRHVRNPIMDKWTSLNIQKVKLDLYDGNCLKLWITFNGRYTNMTNWFSRRNLIASSLFGLKDQEFEEFQTVYKKGFHRLPFVIRSFDDQRWFLVYEPDTSNGYFDDADADQNGEPHDQHGPHFRYRKNTQNHEEEYGSGDRMVISILTEN